MKLQVFLVVATVVALSAQGSVGFAGLGRRGGPGGPGHHHSPEEHACIDLLLPAEEREQIKEIVKTCVTDEGYDTILETIYPDGLPPRTNPIEALEEHGYTEEAHGLRTCVAEATGFVDENGSLDEDKIINAIEEAAAGSPQQENIELGLDNCSTDGFADFETCEFIKCIISYCATGAAP